MSFTIFPRHAKYGHSSWQRQVILNRSTSKSENTFLSVTTTTTNNNDTSSSDESDSSDTLVAHAQKEALEVRRSLDVQLDPTLYQRLQQDARQLNNMSSTSDNGHGEKCQVRKLKSSLRQVVSAPTSPQHGPSRHNQHQQKSVKFDPLHLEKICIFEGNRSPNEVPRFEENNIPPFKVVYSHWPPIQHTIFQQQQNVQLKRSLKLLEGGSILRGQVMVRNLGYEKHVEIRYTMDGWQSVKNVNATYSHGRGVLDTFIYEIDIEQGMLDRGYLRVTLDMAVRYTVLTTTTTTTTTTTNKIQSQEPVEETFWDNNDGYNYQIQVVETVTPSAVSVSATATATVTLDNTIHDDDDEENDDNVQFIPPSPFKSSSNTSASYRYDFGQSLLKTKRNKPTVETIPIEKQKDNNTNLSPFDSIIEYSLQQRKTQSAPSSPSDSPSFLDFFNNSTTNHSLTSSSYSDLVNKYCFYGSQDTSSSSPALSMNG